MIYFLEHTNLFVLARLNQEYQVEWLSNEIEKYLSTAKFTKNTDLILGYLQLSMEMEFRSKVEDHLINEMLSETFSNIQSSSLFISLNRNIQIKIARKCLGVLMEKNGFSSFVKKLEAYLIILCFKSNLPSTTTDD